jgi:hypothetical protein
MFKDLATRAKLAASAAQTFAANATNEIQAATTPTRDDGKKQSNGVGTPGKPSSGIKTASREELMNLLRRSRAQNKQVKAKYVELSKKQKHFEAQTVTLQRFLNNSVGITLGESITEQLIDGDLLRKQWETRKGSQPPKVQEEDLLGLTALGDGGKDKQVVAKLQNDLAREKGERTKVLSKLREVVDKYKQLQKHARTLKENLEKTEADADNTLNKAGEAGLHLIEENKALSEEVEKMKKIAEENNAHKISFKKKIQNIEKLLRESEESKAELERKCHDMTGDAAANATDKARLEQTVQKLESALASAEHESVELSNTVELSSPKATVEAMENRYKLQIKGLQESLEAASVDAELLHKLQQDAEALRGENTMLIAKTAEVESALKDSKALIRHNANRERALSSEDSLPVPDMTAVEHEKLKQRVAFLTKKGKELLGRHRKLEEKYKVETEKISGLEQQLKSAEEKNTLLGKDLKEYELRVESITSAAAESMVDSGDKDVLLQEAEGKIEDAQTQHESEKKLLNEKITQLQEGLLAATGAKTTLEADIKVLQSANNENDKEEESKKEALNDELNFFREELEKLRESNSRHERREAELGKKHEAAIETLKLDFAMELESKTNATTMEKTRMVQTHAATVLEMRKEVDDLLESHSQKIKELQDAHEDAVKKYIEDANKTNEQKIAELKNLHEETIKQMNNSITQQSKQNDGLQEQQQRALESHNNVVSELEKAKVEHSKIMSALNEQLQKIRKQHKGEIEVLKQDASTTIGNMNISHKEEMESLNVEHIAMVDTINARQNDALEKVKSTYEATMDKLKTEYTKAIKAVESLHDEHKIQVNSLNKSHEKECNDLKREVRDLQDENKHIKTALASKEGAEVKALKKQVEDVTAKRSLQAQHHTTELEKLKIANNKLMDSLKSTHTEELGKVSKEMQALQESHDNLSNEYKAMLSSKDEAGSEVELLKKKIEAEMANRQALEEKHMSSDQALESKHNESMASMQASFDEKLQAKEAELKAKDESNKKETAKKMSVVKAKFVKMQADQKAAVETLKSTHTEELGKVSKEMQALQESHDKLSNEYKAMLSSKDEAGSEVEVLKKKIATSNEQTNIKMERLLADYESLEEALAKKDQAHKEAVLKLKEAFDKDKASVMSETAESCKTSHMLTLTAAIDEHRVKVEGIKAAHSDEIANLKSELQKQNETLEERLNETITENEVLQRKLEEADEMRSNEKGGMEKSLKILEEKHSGLSDQYSLLKQKSSFAVIEHQKEAAEYRKKVEEVEKRTRVQLEEMRKRMDEALTEMTNKASENRSMRTDTKKHQAKHKDEMENLQKRFESIKQALHHERETANAIKADGELIEEWKNKVEEIENKLVDVKKTDKAIIAEINQNAQKEVFKAKQEANEQTKITMKALERLRQEESRSDKYRDEARSLKKKLQDSDMQIKMAKAQIQQLATFAGSRGR